MTSKASGKLYVGLSASQTRRRLKGHGLGVRRVESAGRRRAVIFHTATGQHRRELLALFADVPTETSIEALETPIEDLRNPGATSAVWLREVNVRTREDLERIGAVMCFRFVRNRYPRASLNLLWALVGAVTNRDWRDITSEEKGRLRAELESD